MKFHSRFLRAFILFLLIFSFPLLAFPRDYVRKVFLWRGVEGMETQVRDTVLYVGKEPVVEKVSASSAKMTSPENQTPAVIICPGGSYHHLGMSHEGFAAMRWFTSVGIRAFVLQYRVAYNEHHYPDQLVDFQRAISYIRDNASEFNVNPDKIGAIGYSAGGHLVTMAGEFASTHNELEKMGIKSEQSLRPDFVMPIYPVVSMQDDIAHKWSRKSLLGHVYDERASEGFSLINLRGFKYSQSYKDEFSMELNVPDDMPPVFLLACEDDPVVIYENSVRLDKALSEKGINHIFVSYPKGGHGFGMKEDSYIMRETHWNEKDLLPWLKEIGVLGN